MKACKLFVNFVLISIFSLISVISALADEAPNPESPLGNVEVRWYTGVGGILGTEECFDIPNSWAYTTISYWHTYDEKWVELKTVHKTVDGVTQACAVINNVGWIALQGFYTDGFVNPELEFCQRVPEHADCQATQVNPPSLRR